MFVWKSGARKNPVKFIMVYHCIFAKKHTILRVYSTPIAAIWFILWMSHGILSSVPLRAPQSAHLRRDFLTTPENEPCRNCFGDHWIGMWRNHQQIRGCYQLQREAKLAKWVGVGHIHFKCLVIAGGVGNFRRVPKKTSRIEMGIDQHILVTWSDWTGLANNDRNIPSGLPEMIGSPCDLARSMAVFGLAAQSHTIKWR